MPAVPSTAAEHNRRFASAPGTLLLGALVLALGCGTEEGPSRADASALPDADVASDASTPRPGDASTPPVARDASEEDAFGGSFADATGDATSNRFPTLLSETGLYSDVGTETLAPGVRAYEPAHVLWTDGAVKRRWVFLPDGVIDTTEMDFWRYPAGTKVWKEFNRDGKRIETRLLHKQNDGPDGWVKIAYQWLEDGSDAIAVPDGQENAAGTDHDIPSQEACEFCHGNMVDDVLGFSALQLAHDGPGLTLDALIAEGRLSVPPTTLPALPGDALARRALGYLHANCGMCHNARSEVYTTIDMELWQDTSSLGAVRDTSAYRTTVDRPIPGATVNRIVLGDPDRSMVFARISMRGNGQMPPLGTEIVDPIGSVLIRDFIASLTPPDAGAPDANDGLDASNALDASAALDAASDGPNDAGGG